MYKLLKHITRSILDIISYIPTSIFALLLFFLLAFNALSILTLHVPSLKPNSPSFSTTLPSKVPSFLHYVVKEETPGVNSSTHLGKDKIFIMPINKTILHKPKARTFDKSEEFKILGSGHKGQSSHFSFKLKRFFYDSNCKLRFFMTWVSIKSSSSLDSFGDREIFAIESLFTAHYSKGCCLVIVSNSMDSKKGRRLLKPFREKGFNVIAISPDFEYLTKNTDAQGWFSRLRNGNVNPGDISLGQNLSNLLRLVLLYKFGGVYLDTDVIVLKSFGNLRNVIGAQSIDAETGHWSRLNNAVLVFDKHHPLVYKFIQEFALTFDGNKWGHNGPYLVSRVVARVTGRAGYNFTVLPPSAFYPVYWSRVQTLFRGPRGDGAHSKERLLSKLRQIENKSYAMHLWNKQSRELEIEDGSIISHMMSDHCVLCNSSKLVYRNRQG